MRRLTRSETNSGMMLSGEENSGPRRLGRKHVEQTSELSYPNFRPRRPTLCIRIRKVAAPADQLEGNSPTSTVTPFVSAVE